MSFQFPPRFRSTRPEARFAGLNMPGFFRDVLPGAVAATLIATAAVSTPSSAAETQATAIVGATIFDATGAAPYVGTVVISGGRITAVGPTVKVPRGAKVLHAEGEALLPGFYDVHTHWTPAGVPAMTPAIANAYIAAGVTTVDDFNQQPEAFEPRREWLSHLTTPHVNQVARLSTPGGHGADWADVATTKWVNTPEAARAAIRGLVAYRPDAIKAFTDGWRYGLAPDNTSMDVRTLAALVDESHKNHLPVLTHTVTVSRGADAGVARVDIIAHSLQDRLVDAAAVAAIKSGGGAYTGTLAVYEPVKPGQAPPKDMDNPLVRQRFEKFDNALKNIKTLHDAGVMIVLGTDAGMPGAPHGTSTLREMELMVKAGLTPTEALMAGTVNSAKALGQQADRGSIEVGKRADLVLIKGAPWVDISDVRKTDRTIIDGKIAFGPGSVSNPMNAMLAPPAVKAVALVDDFERADGRTQLDTLRTDNPDGGLDRSIQVTEVLDRLPGHALSVSAKLAVKKTAMAAVVIPLTRGAVTPVDARAFQGVRMEFRGGQGPYRVAVRTITDRWSVEIPAGGDWHVVTAPFSDMKRDRAASEEGDADVRAPPAVWTGDDLVAIEITGQGEAGGKIWYQLDNVTFY
jgi:imidazolonepropionase-like amidohydrolase